MGKDVDKIPRDSLESSGDDKSPGIGIFLSFVNFSSNFDLFFDPYWAFSLFSSNIDRLPSKRAEKPGIFEKAWVVT